MNQKTLKTPKIVFILSTFLLFSVFVQVVYAGTSFHLTLGSRGGGDGEFRAPRGMTVDSAGDVYVADTDNDRIQVFDSDGNFLRKWGSEGFGNNQFFGPRDVALDSVS